MKKLLTLLLLAAMLTAPLAGCGDTDDTPAQTTEGKGNGTVNGTDDTIPEYNAADANPASDFEYEAGEDGGITITKYVGTDTDVVIPEKIDGKDVTVIGPGAFNRCAVLETVVMSDKVITIANSAFSKCDRLTAVGLSNALVSIGEVAFGHNENLSSITLPDTLTCIGTFAFTNCKSLKHINIPAHSFDNVPKDGACNGAFRGSGLESVDLAEGIQFIPNATFAETMLKEVVLPDSLQYIDSSAFADCTSLEKITLNEGLTTISYKSFANTRLTEIVIPKSVKICLSSAFEGVTTLQKVYFEGNAPELFMAGEEGAPFTVYYHESATGFTSPEWNGHKTEIW
ncbi:MAG: leucine-rich repeat protein [Clostridia bacterium]|nr:leucine-rich repeat protein [Clostridia bacterium]